MLLCLLLVDGLSFVRAGMAPPTHAGCTSELDCSLNGGCQQGTCHCDSGWIGARCERLQLLPARLDEGYNHLAHTQSVSSWGATQGAFDEDDGLYHTFVGELANGCGIDSYETNELIVHATSKSQRGPWRRVGPVHPAALAGDGRA